MDLDLSLRYRQAPVDRTDLQKQSKGAAAGSIVHVPAMIGRIRGLDIIGDSAIARVVRCRKARMCLCCGEPSHPCSSPRALLGIGVGTSWSPAVYIFYTDLSGEERLTDAGLVYRAQQGDAAAWEELVRAHQGTIFRFAYLLVGDADDAEDIAQEAFIRAFHALSSFDTTRSLRPWLLRIAANLAQNRRRAAGRYLAALRRAFQAEPAPVAFLEEHSGQREEAATVWQAIRRLPPAHQEVIYLRYFLDLSEAEMAATLQVAGGTVKSRLHRALGHLRTVVDRDFPALREAREE